jgi:asparagine synthase (glutamine-hydrolysing)
VCGIAGLFAFQAAPPQQARLQAMGDIQSHRGPDSDGLWISETSPVGFIHRRLSILDPSPAGHQPFQLDGISLTYNGEIYNFLELRSELEARGVVFTTDCDTEVLLRAYQQWGFGCLEKFNGMWAFALWDERQQHLFCSRDRFGVKPFYYTLKDGEFRFASEPKALVNDDPELRRPNPRAVGRFFTEGLLDDEEETFFENIHPLPAAHYFVISRKGELKRLRYWSIDAQQSVPDALLQASNRLLGSPSFHELRVNPLNFDAGPHETLFPSNQEVNRDWFTCVEAFQALFADSVRLRLRSDVPVGTCLSGGLDSTSIISIASNYITHPMKSFSSIYHERGCDEGHFIDEVIKGCSTDAERVFPVAADLQEHFENLQWHQDEPSAGPGLFSQWMVMKMAHGKVKVLLDGQGGDELLAGYHPYFEDGLYTRVGQAPFGEVQEEAKAASALTGRDYSKTLSSARKHYLMPQWLRNLNKPKPGKIKPTSYMSPEFCRAYGQVDPRRAAPSMNFPEKLNQRLYHDVTRTSIPCLLRYEDRSSMAFSLEARTPFLDYRLVEFAFAMPAVYKIYRDQTKRILRRSMAGIIPTAVLQRQDKMGYPTPAAQWFRSELKTWVDDILLGDSLKNTQHFVDSEVQKVWADHLSGADRTWEIWRFLSFAVWHRQFIQGQRLA